MSFKDWFTNQILAVFLSKLCLASSDFRKKTGIRKILTKSRVLAIHEEKTVMQFSAHYQ